MQSNITKRKQLKTMQKHLKGTDMQERSNIHQTTGFISELLGSKGKMRNTVDHIIYTIW